MPRREDIKKILLIGSGPIVIGQACEFDYSGTQACKALREEGYEVVLVNSNPATIMTDKVVADNVYLKPLEPESIEEILKLPDVKERVDLYFEHEEKFKEQEIFVHTCTWYFPTSFLLNIV